MCRDMACRVHPVFLEISHGHGTPCPYESRYIPIIFLKIVSRDIDKIIPN